MIALLLLLACPPGDRAWRGPTDTGDSGPEVVWTWPADGAVLAAGSTLTVQARITDDDDHVDDLEIQLSVDGVYAQPTLASDGTLSWATTVSSGEHSATLLVTDPLGLTTQAARSWTGNAAPTVQITEPESGSTIDTGSPWSLVVQATDPDGGVEGSFLLVRFDGAEVHRTEPWEPDGDDLRLTMPALTSGAHTIIAEASDGLSSTTTSVTVYGS